LITKLLCKNVLMSERVDLLMIQKPAWSASAERAQSLAPLLRALGDPNRLQLVLLLTERAHTVRELTDATGLSQTLVSHHLAPLRDNGLVTVTPRGRANVYQLCCEAFADPVKMLASVATSTEAGAEACCVAAP